MILTTATIAEAIVVLTALAGEAGLTLAAAEAAKALIIKWGLTLTFRVLLERCEARIAEGKDN